MSTCASFREVEQEAAINEVQAYVEEFLPEDEALGEARKLGLEVGAEPIGPAGGAALRFIGSLINARTVVEIGSGCGVSGIWLLRGMHTNGVLTSVDVEPENQRLAKLAYTDAGEVQDRYKVSLIPQNFLIGRDGVIRYAGTALPPDYETLLDALLKDGGAARPSQPSPAGAH